MYGVQAFVPPRTDVGSTCVLTRVHPLWERKGDAPSAICEWSCNSSKTPVVTVNGLATIYSSNGYADELYTSSFVPSSGKMIPFAVFDNFASQEATVVACVLSPELPRPWYIVAAANVAVAFEGLHGVGCDSVSSPSVSMRVAAFTCVTHTDGIYTGSGVMVTGTSEYRRPMMTQVFLYNVSTLTDVLRFDEAVIALTDGTAVFVAAGRLIVFNGSGFTLFQQSVGDTVHLSAANEQDIFIGIFESSILGGPHTAVIVIAGYGAYTVEIPQACIVTVAQPFEKDESYYAVFIPITPTNSSVEVVGWTAELRRNASASPLEPWSSGIAPNQFYDASGTTTTWTRVGVWLLFFTAPFELRACMVFGSRFEDDAARPFSSVDLRDYLPSGAVAMPPLCQQTVLPFNASLRTVAVVVPTCHLLLLDPYGLRLLVVVPRLVMPGTERLSTLGFGSVPLMRFRSQVGTQVGALLPSGRLAFEFPMGPNVSFAVQSPAAVILITPIALTPRQSEGNTVSLPCVITYDMMDSTTTSWIWTADALNVLQGAVTPDGRCASALQTFGGFSALPASWRAIVYNESAQATQATSIAQWAGVKVQPSLPNGVTPVSVNFTWLEAASGIGGYVAWASSVYGDAASWLVYDRVDLTNMNAVFGELDLLFAPVHLNVSLTSLHGNASLTRVPLTTAGLNISLTKMRCNAGCFNATVSPTLQSVAAVGVPMRGPLLLRSNPNSTVAVLRHLDLSWTEIGGGLPQISETTTYLPMLEVVALRGCNLSGPVWKTLQALSRLRILDLRDNALTLAEASSGMVAQLTVHLQIITASPTVNKLPIETILLSGNQLAGEVNMYPAPLPLLTLLDVSRNSLLAGTFDGRISARADTGLVPREVSLPLHVNLTSTGITAMVMQCADSATQYCTVPTVETLPPWLAVERPGEATCVCAGSPDAVIGYELPTQPLCASVPSPVYGSPVYFQVYPYAAVVAANPSYFEGVDATAADEVYFFSQYVADGADAVMLTRQCNVSYRYWLAYPSTGTGLFHARVVTPLLPCVQDLYDATRRTVNQSLPARLLTVDNVTLELMSASTTEGPPGFAFAVRDGPMLELAAGQCTTTDPVLGGGQCGERGVFNTNWVWMRFLQESTNVTLQITGVGMNPVEMQVNVPFAVIALNRTSESSMTGSLFPGDALLAAVNAQFAGNLTFVSCYLAQNATELVCVCDPMHSPESLTFTFLPQLCNDWTQIPQCDSLLPPVSPSYHDSRIKAGLGGLSLEGTALTLLWELCDTSTVSRQYVTNGFARLDQEIPFSAIIDHFAEFLPSVPYTGALQKCADTSSLSCQTTDNNARTLCGRAAWQVSQQYMSCAFNGFDMAAKFQSYYASGGTHVTCKSTYGAVLGAPAGFVGNVSQAEYDTVRTTVQRPPWDLRLHALCEAEGTKVYFVDAATRIPLFEVGSGQCAGSRRFTCSSCLPYLEPSNSSLPYYLLVLSSLKDVVFMLVGLAVLERQWVRERVASFIARLLVMMLPYDRVVMHYDSEDAESDSGDDFELASSQSRPVRPARRPREGGNAPTPLMQSLGSPSSPPNGRDGRRGTSRSGSQASKGRGHFMEFERWRMLWKERYCPRVIREDEVKLNFAELMGLEVDPESVTTRRVLERIRSLSPTGRASSYRRAIGGGPTNSDGLTQSLLSPSDRNWRTEPGSASPHAVPAAPPPRPPLMEDPSDGPAVSVTASPTFGEFVGSINGTSLTAPTLAQRAAQQGAASRVCADVDDVPPLPDAASAVEASSRSSSVRFVGSVNLPEERRPGPPIPATQPPTVLQPRPQPAVDTSRSSGAAVPATPDALPAALSDASGSFGQELSFIRVPAAMFSPTDERYLFFKAVVLRKCRCLVRNTDDEAARRAFRALVEEATRQGDVAALAAGRRKWHRDELKAFKAFDARADMECVLLETDAVDRKFTPQLWMLTLELVYAGVLLVVCLFQGGQNLNSTFARYEAKYFTFVNSCTSVGFVVNAALRVNYAGDHRRPGFFMLSSLALMLPVMVTHILPGMIIFFWLPAVAIPLTVLVLWLAARLKQRGLGFLGIPREHLERVERPVFLTVNVLTRLTATIAATLVFQTLFNYMVLFYHREEMELTYGGIVAYEAASRRFDCLWEKWTVDATKALQMWSTFV
jgi:hypothetical protein